MSSNSSNSANNDSFNNYHKLILAKKLTTKILRRAGEEKNKTTQAFSDVSNPDLTRILKKDQDFQAKFNDLTFDSEQHFIPVRINGWKKNSPQNIRLYVEPSGNTPQIKDITQIRVYSSDNNSIEDNDNKNTANVVDSDNSDSNSKSTSKKNSLRKKRSKKKSSPKKTKLTKEERGRKVERNAKIDKKYEKNERDQLTIEEYKTEKEAYIGHLTTNPSYRLWDDEKLEAQRNSIADDIRKDNFSKTEQVKLLFDKLYSRGLYTPQLDVSEEYINKNIRNDLRNKSRKKEHVFERKDAEKYLEDPLNTDLKGSFDYGGFDKDIAKTRTLRKNKLHKKYEWIKTAVAGKRKKSKKN